MEFLINNWQELAKYVGIVVSFFAGIKIRRIQAAKEKETVEAKKLENYKKAFDTNSDMLDGIKEDFENRLEFFKSSIAIVEESNRSLNKIIENQKIIIERQEKQIRRYEKKYGKLEHN